MNYQEDEIIELLSNGYTNIQIGKRLYLSRPQVGLRLKRILKKYGAKNKIHLVKLWMESNNEEKQITNTTQLK